MTAYGWTQRYYAPAVAKLPRAEPYSFEQSELTYPSLAAFVCADARRLRGRERDFGLRWRDREGDPLFRAAWNEGSRELYLVQTGPPAEGGGHVEVIALARNVDEIERALAGWHRQCGEERSLDWLRTAARERLAPPLNEAGRRGRRRRGGGLRPRRRDAAAS